ncbi:hypothetical protein EF918_22700 [Streptomyces sp. WAC06614]|nr:hypothetical protein EF918_22700 [Streptomyces sp. WAC06614]
MHSRLIHITASVRGAVLSDRSPNASRGGPSWNRAPTCDDAKPSRPGPGRPPGSKNRRPATPYVDVGRALAPGESYARPAHHKVGTHLAAADGRQAQAVHHSSVPHPTS